MNTLRTRTALLCMALVMAGGLGLGADGLTRHRLQRFEFSQVHMGMPVRMVLYATSDVAAHKAATMAFLRIKLLESFMSDYRPDSAISRVAAEAPAAVNVPVPVTAVLKRALEIARASNGAFDPTVAPVVALWREARASGRLPDPVALERARSLVGWDRVEFDNARSTIRLPVKGMRLDLGGIAKGYILSDALLVLGGLGVRSALIEAGGDIVVSDSPPDRAGWRVDVPNAAGVPEPFVARAWGLTHAAFATSGSAAQFLEVNGVRYSHIVDPRTGRAVTGRHTAHVIAKDADTADALATAASVLGPEGLDDLRRRFPDAMIELAQQAPLPGDRSTYEWIPLFNGTDLSGWTPKFAKHPLGTNLNDTFSVADGMLQVRYDKWTGFSGEFGHLFYKEPFSHYVIAAEYRFVGEQLPAAKAQSWAVRNNGLMLHSQDPATMVQDQDFPISIEVQLLGGLGSGVRSTANLCTPGTHVMMDGKLRTAHCTNSKSATFDGDQWVRVEVLVLGDEVVRHLVDGQVVMEYSKPQIGGGNAAPTDPAVKVDGTPLTRGFIAIQSETAPTDFRKIEIVNLEGCTDPKAKNYKAYIVKSNPAACRY